MNHPSDVQSALEKPLPADFVQSMAMRFGDHFSTALAVRAHHGRDESAYDPMPPDAVVFVTSTDDVVTVMKLCGQYAVPLIPYGAGSSLEGHLLAVQGGVSIDMSGMNQVLHVAADDLTATVQAGVTRKQLNQALSGSGLFFPIDPGADATLGGMAATRASGTNAVRYGTMRENVLALTVVTAEGKVLRTAGRAKKSAAGYDLTRLFVGSEGTLGIITEVTVKLYPLPEAISAAVCNFDQLDDAVQSVIQIIQMGVPVARIELVDALGVEAVNRHSKLGLRVSPLLLFEFHGSTAGVQEQAEIAQTICSAHGGKDFEWATQPEDRSRLWAARHNAYFAVLQLRPGARAISTDVCVPISRLAECIRQTTDDLAATSIVSSVVGHVGDGNFHVLLLIDPNQPAEREAAEAINARMVRRAIAMDGTCSGEHGVGLHKMDFLMDEHGDDALDLMRRIKRAFDPQNLLNPGKIIAIKQGPIA